MQVAKPALAMEQLRSNLLKGNILTTLNDTAIQTTMMKGKQVLILLLKYHPPGGEIDTKPKFKEHKASKHELK